MEIDLVFVRWDEDIGIVSLKQNKVLFTAYGDCTASTNLPEVVLEDNDFDTIHDSPDRDDPDYDVVEDESFWETANWENVPTLLMHPDFKLADRLTKRDDGSTEYLRLA